MVKKDADGLTPKQKMFCEEYMANGYSAMQAYLSVYGKKQNPSPTYPYDLLRNPQVKAYLQKRRQEVYDSLNIDAIRIAQELADMAFAAKEDEIYVPTVKLKALEQLSKILGLQVQKVDTSGTIEVTLEQEEIQNDTNEEND